MQGLILNQLLKGSPCAYVARLFFGGRISLLRYPKSLDPILSTKISAVFSGLEKNMNLAVVSGLESAVFSGIWQNWIQAFPFAAEQKNLATSLEIRYFLNKTLYPTRLHVNGRRINVVST